MSDLLKKNAITDVKDLLDARGGRTLLDEDVAKAASEGIPVGLAAISLAEDYTGSNAFMSNMRVRVAQGKSLSIPMVRGILNARLCGSDTKSATTPPEQRKYSCFTCKKEFVGLETIRAHGRQHKSGDIDAEGNPVTEAPVIENRVSTMDLDLSMLPDGRYAVPDFAGKNDLVFLMVRRVKKSYRRNRLYVYGKILRGMERVEAGTIEVKEWSSDSKRLCGEQKAGEVYKGEFEKQLDLVLKSPEAWAKLFGLQVGRCYRCGKTLTDEDSRAQGIGPECVKVNNYFTTPPPDYSKPAAATV